MNVQRRKNLPTHCAGRGAVVWAIGFLSLTLACVSAYAQQDAAAPQQPQGHHKFVEVSTGRAFPPKGGMEASVHNWESEDGTLVQVLHEWYKSPGDAHDALDKLIGKASRVTKQDTKKGPKGNVIGRRVELLFSGSDKTSTQFVIAWSDTAQVIRLRSKSLPLLLDFESQAYP